ALQVERPGRPRRGQIWVEGRWDWQGGQWNWMAGHWERAQPGKRWHRGEWVQQGNQWQWNADRWDDVPAYPTMAPPAPQPESMPAPRAGYLWVGGHYAWNDGQYQ